MKRSVASVGMVAVGATGLQAAYAPGLSRMETTKPWSLSASLRGFYDDNYLTQTSGFEEESFGFEISPSIAVNFPMEQTYVGLSYTYALRYYEARSSDSTDHNHEFLAKVDHKFSERYSASFEDSFVYSDEPEIVETGVLGAPITRRRDASAFRNRANLDFKAQLTELWGLGLGYQNTWYDYEDDGPGGLSALLDRVEHVFRVDGRYTIQPNLIGLIGYQYQITDYTSDDLLPSGSPGDIRDNTSHLFSVGADYAATSQINASFRVGAQYTEFDDLDQSSWTPYVDMYGTYTYLPGSYVRFGIRHARNATDADGTPGDITTDQQTTALYGLVNHRITPRITGSAVGQLQHAVFENGALDGEVDNLYTLGLNFEYRISQHWSAETGYNWDRLDSDLGGRSFTRNRVYVGVRATY